MVKNLYYADTEQIYNSGTGLRPWNTDWSQLIFLYLQTN